MRTIFWKSHVFKKAHISAAPHDLLEKSNLKNPAVRKIIILQSFQKGRAFSKRCIFLQFRTTFWKSRVSKRRIFLQFRTTVWKSRTSRTPQCEKFLFYIVFKKVVRFEKGAKSFGFARQLPGGPPRRRDAVWEPAAPRPGEPTPAIQGCSIETTRWRAGAPPHVGGGGHDLSDRVTVPKSSKQVLGFFFLRCLKIL